MTVKLTQKQTQVLIKAAFHVPDLATDFYHAPSVSVAKALERKGLVLCLGFAHKKHGQAVTATAAGRLLAFQLALQPAKK